MDTNMLSLLLKLVVLGVGLFFIETYIPMDSKIKQVLNIIVVLLLVYYVVLFGFDAINSGVPALCK